METDDKGGTLSYHMGDVDVAERAAIYIRLSTEHDEQKLSPEHQLAACKKYAEETGLIFDPTLVYNDAGLSGTEMENRTEVRRMLSDARFGKFNAVLFTAISRFSRDLSDAFALKKRLEQVYGIRLVSIEEGYDSAVEGRNNDMVFTVFGMLASHMSEEMSKAIKRGLRQSARDGRHTGNVTPYGYTKTADKRLTPDAKTVPVVRDIFSWYLDGFGTRSIAERLNERNIPSAKGKPWQPSTVNAILHNRAYRGDIVANKWTIETDFEHSRRVDKRAKRQSTRDEDEWVITEGAHEAIIEPDVFDKVQTLLAQKAGNRYIWRKSNLLAGLLKCKECGSAMIVYGNRRNNRVYRYVICSKVKRIGKAHCDNHKIQPYGPILNDILHNLSSAARQPEWIDSIVEIVQRQIKGTPHDIQRRIEELQRELTENQAEQVKTLQAFTSGLFPTNVIELRQRQLVERTNHILKEITRLQGQTTQREQAFRSTEELKEAFNVFANLEQYDEMTKRLSLRKVIERIEFDRGGNIHVRWTWATV